MQENVEKMDVETKDTKSSSKIKFNKLDIIGWVIMGIGIIICTAMLIEIKKSVDYIEEYKTSVESNYANAAEYAATVAEINSYYDTYALKNGADFDLCTDAALTYYMAGLNDKYATYMTPESYEKTTEANNERSTGIGILVSYNEEHGLRIAKVYPNSAAEEAGLQYGDKIIYAGGTYLEDVTYNEFLKCLRGEVGDTLTIKYMRGGEEYEIDVVLKNYDLRSVSSRLVNDNTAYVEVTDFSLKTHEEFIPLMSQYRRDGIENYIIDLRNNGGGFLDTVVPMIDFMVGKGTIVTITDCNGVQYYEAKSDSKEFHGNIVVLINESSASASELFAQNMKDFKKAYVIGTQSYGKGTVLSEFKLTNGGGITLSTGMYKTNSGAELEDVGVTPDLVVELTEEQKKNYYFLSDSEDSQMAAAIEYLNNISSNN